jgi:hypothetical protein
MGNQVNPQAVPFFVQKYLSIVDCKISNDATTPNTILDISSGICRDQTDTYDLNIGNYNAFQQQPVANSVTKINAAVNGINGLDTGSLGASHVYYVYVVGDPVSANQTGAMISLAAPSIGPLMPFGYSAFRHIGYVVTDGSMHFLKGYNAGGRDVRVYMYDAPISVGTTSSEAAYTAIALTNFVPAVDNLLVYLNVSFSGTAADTLELQPGNATGDAIVIEAAVTSQAVKQQVAVLSQLVAGVPTINYKNSGTDTIAITVGGFQYSV